MTGSRLFHLLDLRTFGARCGATSGPVVSDPCALGSQLAVAERCCAPCLELWRAWRGPELGSAGELPQIDWRRIHEAQARLLHAIARPPAKNGAPSTAPRGVRAMDPIFADHVASVLTNWSNAFFRLVERASGTRVSLASIEEPFAAARARGGAAVRGALGGLWMLIRRAALKGRN